MGAPYLLILLRGGGSPYPPGSRHVTNQVKVSRDTLAKVSSDTLMSSVIRKAGVKFVTCHLTP
jgi:hypothetical protein